MLDCYLSSNEMCGKKDERLKETSLDSTHGPNETLK